MTTPATTPHLLLIESDEGNTVAVRFRSASAARTWEDEHEDKMGTVIGCVPVVSRAEALRG